MPKTCRRLLILFLLLASPGATFAQERPSARFKGQVEVKEVLLDVLATDRSGQVVEGLGKEDFVVEEGGKRVELTAVSFYTTRYRREDVAQPGGGVVPASRYLIFFFHDQSRLGAPRARLLSQQLRASLESRHWVEESMMPSDWVAVVSYDVRLKVHQDFTQDRALILAGIADAGRNRDPEKGMGRRGRELPPLGAPSLLRHLPQGKELRKQTTLIYGGIGLLAEAAGYVVGRKNLLLFSIGFGDFGVNPVPIGDPRYYPKMERSLNDHNVAVYPIDLTPPEFEHLQSHFLNRLASDTGGYYYENFVSFTTPIERISEENVGYYLLSYSSEHPAGKAGYQQVKVRARNRSVQLRTRKGYRYGSS